MFCLGVAAEGGTALTEGAAGRRGDTVEPAFRSPLRKRAFRFPPAESLRKTSGCSIQERSFLGDAAVREGTAAAAFFGGTASRPPTDGARNRMVRTIVGSKCRLGMAGPPWCSAAPAANRVLALVSSRRAGGSG